jgi:hypothetical protein
LFLKNILFSTEEAEIPEKRSTKNANENDRDSGINFFSRRAGHTKFHHDRAADIFLEDHHVPDHLHGGTFGHGLRFRLLGSKAEG